MSQHHKSNSDQTAPPPDEDDLLFDQQAPLAAESFNTEDTPVMMLPSQVPIFEQMQALQEADNYMQHDDDSQTDLVVQDITAGDDEDSVAFAADAALENADNEAAREESSEVKRGSQLGTTSQTRPSQQLIDVDDDDDVNPQLTAGRNDERTTKRARVRRMTHFEVHKAFTKHWETQSATESKFRHVIREELNTDADRLRFDSLINIDNWEGPPLNDVRLPLPLVDPTNDRCLKPHQLEGIRFMWRLLVNGPVEEVPAVGCILAHSMGLGKTCQVLVFMHLFWQHVTHGRILLVVPKSTLVSWEAEINTWSQYFPANGPSFKIFDDKLPTTERLRYLRRWMDDGGAIVCGYESLVALQRQIAKTASHGDDLIFDVDSPTDLLVCDEAHRIKNAERDVVKALTKVYPERRLLMTGTPMQNHLLEYWAMVEFTIPRYFERRAFQQFFIKPILQAMTHSAHHHEVAAAKKKTYTLIRELETFVQRRDNTILRAELPPMYEFVLTVDLTPMQTALYEKMLTVLRNEYEHGKFNLLQACSYAGKICTHPDLLYSSKAEGTIFEELCKRPADFIPEPSQSNKMKLATSIILKAKERGEKTLVFSQSTQLLDFFEQVMQHEGFVATGNRNFIEFLRIDGSMNSEDRTRKVHSFQSATSTADVFLLSTRAGGMGLTLTAASRVILLDCSWNPADERQAMCRAYRYGQTKPVAVYRLVSRNTIEHRIYDQKMAKDWLFNTVVEDKQVKRDTLVGTKLQEIFFLKETTALSERFKQETAVCVAADAILPCVRELFFTAATHDTLLEEDPITYGDDERGYYNKFKKQGGLWASAESDAEAGGTSGGNATDLINAQATRLNDVIGRLISRRRELEAQAQPVDMFSINRGQGIQRNPNEGGSLFSMASRNTHPPRPRVHPNLREVVVLDDDSQPPQRSPQRAAGRAPAATSGSNRGGPPLRGAGEADSPIVID